MNSKNDEKKLIRKVNKDKLKQILANKHVKKVLKVVKYAMICIVVLLIGAFILDEYVKASTDKQIVTAKDDKKLSDIDCIIILGAAVWGDKPSPMLQDRLTVGMDLYNKDVSKKIIMSGDHGKTNYDEVGLMKNYVVDKGIPSKDVFKDHAGFSTYDTIYRAKEVFKAKKIAIVTQKYHLYRALYIANKLGVEAYGVAADLRDYHNQTPRDIREILARDKDAVKCIFKPKSKYLGEAIPVSGDGDVTND